ncbi:MAG: hypothetical protein ABJ388_15390 [Alphaproteobacteria bacterium]
MCKRIRYFGPLVSGIYSPAGNEPVTAPGHPGDLLRKMSMFSRTKPATSAAGKPAAKPAVSKPAAKPAAPAKKK